MRTLLPLAILTVVLPANAAGAPTVYVCTPGGQVLTVDGATGATMLLYPQDGGSRGTFDECVLGPDGRLYVANENSVLRFHPDDPEVTDETIVTLTAPVRGLSFNVTTLFMNTAGAGVRMSPGISEVALGGPFPAAVRAFDVAADGRGITFDVQGTLLAAAGTKVRSATPPYTSSAALPASNLGRPMGVGVNTCREVLVADKTSRSIKRLTANGAFQTVSGLEFTGPDIPIHFEVGASNQIFILTAEDESGSNAKIWRADPVGANPIASCSAATLTLLVDLKALLYGFGGYSSIGSSAALGLAVSPTDHPMTRTFSAEACSQLYDFGYHTVRVTFGQCLTPFQLKISALKSMPSQVTFDPTIFTTKTGGLRYSPLGGFVIQYRYEGPLPVAGVDFAAGTEAYQATYSFFTQEAVDTPGVARSEHESVTGVYDQNVGDDYWDVGALDAAAGDRGDIFSKRVVFNAALVQRCVWLGFKQPLSSGHPQFNSGQSVKISGTAVDAVTGGPCTGGTLRVSIARLEQNDFVVQKVISRSHQVDNLMDSGANGHYEFLLDTSGYQLGTYLITLWGDVLPIQPGSSQKTFVIGHTPR